MNKKEHLNGLELLRYVLGMYIVLYHTCHYDILPSWITRTVEMGFVGTSTFFILSGFILSYVYLKGNGSDNIYLREEKGSFLMKRFANLYPIHIFSLIITLIVVYYLGVLKIEPKDALSSIRYVMYDSNNYSPIEKLHHFMSNTEMTIAFIMNIFLLQSWNPYYLTFNAPAWSISMLFFMYLLFPFIAPYLSKVKRPMWGLLLTNVVYISFPIIFIALNLFDMPFTGILNRNPLMRLPEFISGILLCNLFLKIKEKQINISSIKIRLSMVFFIIISLIIGNVFLHNPDMITKNGNAPYYLLHNGMLLITECLIILLFCSIKIKKSKLLSLLGGASLPLFALHIPVYLVFSRVEFLLTEKHNIIYYPLFLLLVTIICMLFQEKIVVPTRKKILNLTIYRSNNDTK